MSTPSEYDLGLGDINDLAAEAAGGRTTGGESAAAVAEPSIEPSPTASTPPVSQSAKPPTSPEGEERDRRIRAGLSECDAAQSRIRARLSEVAVRIASIGDPFAARQSAVDRRVAGVTRHQDTIKLLEIQHRRFMSDANTECDLEQERAQWTAEELNLLKQEQAELLRSQAGEIEPSTAVKRSDALAERIQAARERAASIK